MKILACDDEYLALTLLEKAIQEACPDAELFVFDDVDEALECAKDEKIDVAFLDIQMPGMTGLELAKALKDINGKINIIFATGYDEFMKDGLELRMSGYLFKPVTVKAIKEELENLRNPVVWDAKKVRVQTFGNFAVFVDNEAIKFERKQSKEILAYLVDKRGTGVTYKELAAVLYEDDEFDRSMQKNIQVYVASLVKTLEKYGVKHIINKNRKEIMIDTSNIDCDYYRFLNRDVAAINSYTGQYMNEYSWAEFTASFLDRKIS